MSNTFKIPEPADHVYPSTLTEFETAETRGECYSIAVGCPGEVSIPLYTSEQVKEILEQCIKKIDNYSTDYRALYRGHLPYNDYLTGFGDGADNASKIINEIKEMLK